MGRGRPNDANRWRLAGAVAVMAEQCQARGPRGAVAAAAPAAALIGIEMLRAGGNAYDAAVAAALAETVLLPPKCGLAGRNSASSQMDATRRVLSASSRTGSNIRS